MRAHKVVEPRGTRIESALTWVGGGQWHELGERHERSTHAIAGVVVLLNAALAWLVATVAFAEAARWPIPAIVPLTLLFGLLVGAITRVIASGPTRGWGGIVGRGAVAVAVGVVVGELAALVVFSGSIDRRLDGQAARNADSTPAAVQAAADLQRIHNARIALDEVVDEARIRRDEALVVARCEYNPTPACPQTRITGVPGTGPETRTANEQLGDAQQELNNAVAARDRRAPELDSQIGSDVAKLTQARQGVIADADRGLGARWVAMGDLTLASAGALLLRLVTIAFFALMSLLPLILQLWRGETTHDRHAAARAERDRAEVEADTAIAVKRAEVRAAAETMWAEQQLAQARLAVEAQAEIDRAHHRRRVAEALEGSRPIASEPVEEEEDMYLPIAAEAEAASLAAAELPAGDETAPEPVNLPAPAPATPLIPTIPEVTRAAARWIRPLVPTFVTRAIDTTTQPLRAARQVFEEVEEITFSFKRTRKVTVNTEESAGRAHAPGSAVTTERLSLGAIAPDVSPSLEPSEGRHQVELTQRHGPAELRAFDGPRELPSAE